MTQRGSAEEVGDATLDPRQGFRAHAAAAARDRQNSQLTAEMINSGVLLAKSNCSDFFRGSARLQRSINFTRSAVAPVITVLTSIIGFTASGGDEANIRRLAIGSTAVTAGISLVDQHFLFGADNVIEVEELTKRALDAHAAGINDLGPLSFTQGVEQLIDHQVICTPASILKLTKSAIAAGVVAAVATGDSAEDEAALERLAGALGLIGTASSEQATALWRLYQGGVQADNVPQALVDELSRVNLGYLIDPPVAVATGADGTVTPAQPAKISARGTAVKAPVIAALKSFAASTRTAMGRPLDDDGRSDDGGVGTRRPKTIRLTVH